MDKPITTREQADGQALASLEPGARVLLPLSTGEHMNGIVIGRGFVPGEVKVLWDDGLITHIRSSQLGVCDE